MIRTRLPLLAKRRAVLIDLGISALIFVPLAVPKRLDPLYPSKASKPAK